MSEVLAKLVVTKDTGGLYGSCKMVMEYFGKDGHLARSDIMMFRSKPEDEMLIAFPVTLELYPFAVDKEIARRFTDILIRNKDDDGFEIDIISNAKH